MASSIFEYPDSFKAKDIFDDLYDTDPEETAFLNRQRLKDDLKKEADVKINKFLQFLNKRIGEFRSGEISQSFLCCEMFRLAALVNDEVVS